MWTRAWWSSTTSRTPAAPTPISTSVSRQTSMPAPSSSWAAGPVGWRWNREATYERFDSPHGPMACWLELVSVGNGLVRFEGHNVFSATGEVVVASSELRFRSLAELTDSVINSGFTVEHVYGDWDRGP